jgi:hypothetical protein
LEELYLTKVSELRNVPYTAFPELIYIKGSSEKLLLFFLLSLFFFISVIFGSLIILISDITFPGPKHLIRKNVGGKSSAGVN